jgi:formylglycine-generating enzyme required for sulfatase activity
VVLKPRFASITLRVASDADIYVNGELKGRRSWTGRLNSGSYQVECRQTNHRPSTQAISIQENESRTIDLTAPTPITGMLSVVSQPLGATISVDGKEQGTTPRQIRQLLIGSHTLVLNKEGYERVTQTFDITEGQTTNLNIAMKKGMATQPVSSSDDQVFTLTNNGKTVTFRMKPVGAGSFEMGSNSGGDDEKPVHRVTLTNDYYMGETEVTQELWEAVMGRKPSYFKGDKLPVEQVSWNDCQTFIEKLNSLTAGKRPAGRSFRLPTEAEWEYAARGGSKSKGYTYAGSNNIGDVAWYDENSYNKGSNSPDYGTHPVGQKSPNELGLYDMSGNVWEWCADWYGSYPSSSQTNPTGASSGSCRVYRGGSWDYDAADCRSAYRGLYRPASSIYYLGLRLAL